MRIMNLLSINLLKMYNKRYLEIYHLLWVLCYILIEL